MHGFEISTLPDDRHQFVEGSVDAGVLENKSDAIRDYFDEQEDAQRGIDAARRLE